MKVAALAALLFVALLLSIGGSVAQDGETWRWRPRCYVSNALTLERGYASVSVFCLW